MTIIRTLKSYHRNTLPLTQNECVRALNAYASVRAYQSKIDSSKLKIVKISAPKEKTKLENLVFGRTFTDHMLSIDWNTTDGWANPVIHPYDDLRISPAATVLHYGIEVRRHFV